MSLWPVGEQASIPTQSSRCVGDEEVEGGAEVRGVSSSVVVWQVAGRRGEAVGVELRREREEKRWRSFSHAFGFI